MKDNIREETTQELIAIVEVLESRPPSPNSIINAACAERLNACRYELFRRSWFDPVATDWRSNRQP